MKRKPFVLCIAAWVGGGKTTIISELNKRLHNTEVIYFDNYPIDFLKQDYYQWSINGNDYNDWHFEAIANDIENLLQEDADYILLEFPMGRANDLISRYIDYTVFLDVPIDILLARRIIRDYCRRSPNKKKLENPLGSVDEFLADYIARTRVTVFNYIKAVKPLADIVINGYQPVENIVFEIVNQLKLMRVSDPHV